MLNFVSLLHREDFPLLHASAEMLTNPKNFTKQVTHLIHDQDEDFTNEVKALSKNLDDISHKIDELSNFISKIRNLQSWISYFVDSYYSAFDIVCKNFYELDNLIVHPGQQCIVFKYNDETSLDKFFTDNKISNLNYTHITIYISGMNEPVKIPIYDLMQNFSISV